MLALALSAISGTILQSSAAAAQRRTPTLAPSATVIDGPSADIVSLSGMSVARDGTGGLVYVKNVSGVPHIFVSRLLGGRFGAPQQVDAGLPDASSQPVIAAANPGLLLVAFVNDGTLYVLGAANAFSPLSAPGPLFAGAVSPSLSLNGSGKAYLAFTAPGSAGTPDAVRAAYYDQGQWSLEPAPLNADPSESAGDGTGRPSVAASGDGIGIVAWGEGGHIFTRRVWGISPSVVFQQADPGSLSGMTEESADQPAISSGGDSSYAAVAFRESFASGTIQQSRVLMNRLHAGVYDGVAQVDGAAAMGPEGADQPQVAVTEFGRGFVTSEHDQSHNVYAAPLASNESATDTARINSQVIVSDPDAVPAVAGTISTMIAFQQNPGSAGPAEIRLRYASDGSDLDPEQVVSSPALGATNADQGLFAGGDLAGDAAVAWVQGSGPSTVIVAGQLYQTPGVLVPLVRFRYADSPNPFISWSTASELWGSLQYIVKFDGIPISQTIGTTIRVPTPVANGRHTWQVTAVNQAGLSTVAPPSTVFVDTSPPRVSFRLNGSHIIGSTVQIFITDTDSPPPLPPSAASGIKSVQVKWGDGVKPFLRKTTATHFYKRLRTYTVTVIVKDRAGNRTVVTKAITIKPKPKPKPKRKRKKGKPVKHGAAAAQAATLSFKRPGALPR